VTTVAIDKMQFCHPVEVGDTLCCYAELIKVGNTSIHLKITAWVSPGGIEARQKVTEAVFTYVAIDADGKPLSINTN
jgi:acyl-CoA thioesterase YciA